MTDSTQTFRLIRDAERNNILVPAAVTAPTRKMLSVIGLLIVAPPTHATPPGKFERWVEWLEGQCYAVRLDRRG